MNLSGEYLEIHLERNTDLILSTEIPIGVREGRYSVRPAGKVPNG